MGAVSMAPMLLCCGCGYQRALGLVHAAREEREREREEGVPWGGCTGGLYWKKRDGAVCCDCDAGGALGNEIRAPESTQRSPAWK